MAKLNENGFLDDGGDYRNLIFYKKSKIIYDMTFFFKEHFLSRGDRTQDQMEQAARSGKQNIAEGRSDGLTSAEMELKLVNVARASLMELREDYEDYLRVHNLTLWDNRHPRYEKMKQFCYHHLETEQYRAYFERWSAEEFCNVALTLLHQADRGMWKWLQNREKSSLKKEE